MDVNLLANQSLVRQAVMEVANLPDDELSIILEVVEFLKQQRISSSAATSPMRLAELRAKVRSRAIELRNLSRTDLVARFNEVANRIQKQVLTQKTAVNGDWELD